MSKIEFSIIIPTFNEEEMLPDCLDSIKNLDYPDDEIEVIVVDNGSSDNTVKIAESFGIRTFSDTTKNVSGLRNLGAKHSNGRILAFLDADCIVTREWLKNAEKYRNRPEIAAWGSPPTLPDNPTWVQKAWYIVRKRKADVEKVEWLESMNLFVRRDMFMALGGFNEELVTCEDVDFSFRIKKSGDVLSDPGIRVIHLGEAATIREFIKKEVWRGRSNLNGIFSHGLSMKELPSLSIPIYFGLFLPLLIIVYFFTLKSLWGYTVVAFYMFPSIAVLVNKRKNRIVSRLFFPLLFLIQVYFISRTIAILKK